MSAAERLERIAMLSRLDQLREFALKACRGSELERQLAASILVRIAASDWRELMPDTVTCVCGEDKAVGEPCRSEMCVAERKADERGEVER